METKVKLTVCLMLVIIILLGVSTFLCHTKMEDFYIYHIESVTQDMEELSGEIKDSSERGDDPFIGQNIVSNNINTARIKLGVAYEFKQITGVPSPDLFGIMVGMGDYQYHTLCKKKLSWNEIQNISDRLNDVALAIEDKDFKGASELLDSLPQYDENQDLTEEEIRICHY